MVWFFPTLFLDRFTLPPNHIIRTNTTYAKVPVHKINKKLSSCFKRSSNPSQIPPCFEPLNKERLVENCIGAPGCSPPPRPLFTRVLGPVNSDVLSCHIVFYPACISLYRSTMDPQHEEVNMPQSALSSRPLFLTPTPGRGDALLAFETSHALQARRLAALTL
jgi:hypothetical protein